MKILSIILLLAILLTGCFGASDSAEAKVRIVDIPLTDESYAFGVDKNQPELLEQANAFIAQMLSDGTLEAICDKYFVTGDVSPVLSAEQDASKEQLVVATNAMFAPFEYVEGNAYYGIDMEIAAAFAEYLGQELVIIDMDFDAVCLSVGQGKCDIAMAGLTINESRKEHVVFTDPYYQASQVVMVKESDTLFDSCQSAEDVEAILNSLDATTKIGVQSGTTGQYYVAGDEEWGFAGFSVSCLQYQSASLAVQDMLNGNLDYVVVDREPAVYIADAYNK